MYFKSALEVFVHIEPVRTAVPLGNDGLLEFLYYSLLEVVPTIGILILLPRARGNSARGSAITTTSEQQQQQQQCYRKGHHERTESERYEDLFRNGKYGSKQVDDDDFAEEVDENVLVDEEFGQVSSSSQQGTLTPVLYAQ